MFNKSCMSEYDKNRSKKDCCCGGHNLKNVKKNKNHNSTKNRLNIKTERSFFEKILNNQKNLNPEINALANDCFWELLL